MASGDRLRSRGTANRLVTSLILQLSGYGNDPFLGKQRADRIRSPSRNYRQILGDAKFSLEDRDALLYCFQVERFGARVDDWLELDSWNFLQGEPNRFVTLHSRRIDVYIRRKHNFGNEADPAAGYDAAIGLCKRKLKMGRTNILAHFCAQLREQLCDHIISRQSIRVLGCEILFTNNPICVDEEESWVSHPFGHSLRFRVEHVEAANDFGVRVSQ